MRFWLNMPVTACVELYWRRSGNENSGKNCSVQDSARVFGPLFDAVTPVANIAQMPFKRTRIFPDEP
jgi:hypothetical protein